MEVYNRHKVHVGYMLIQVYGVHIHAGCVCIKVHNMHIQWCWSSVSDAPYPFCFTYINASFPQPAMAVKARGEKSRAGLMA